MDLTDERRNTHKHIRHINEVPAFANSTDLWISRIRSNVDVGVGEAIQFIITKKKIHKRV